MNALLVTQETTMKTQTSMLSGIAIAALATVTLNSSEALAKGGPSGMGGMRSFSVVRTPIVVTKYKALNTTTKVSATTVRDHRQQTTVVRDHRTTNVVVRDHRNDKATLPTGTATLNPQGGVSVTPTGGGVSTAPGGVTVTPTGGGVSTAPGGVTVTPGGTIHLPPPGTVVVKPPGGGIIVAPGPGGNLPPVEPPPAKPPVVVVNPPASVNLGVAAAAPVAVDPPGCVYERSVRKLPGGGLQRVLIKICPDVVVQ